MSRIILIAFLFIAIGISTAAIIHFYADYSQSLKASLTSAYYDGGSPFPK